MTRLHLDNPVCACGHVLDEHDTGAACTVDDCPCVHYDDEGDVCGETYDHILQLIEERDGLRTYVCQQCGAEIQDEAEEEQDPDPSGDTTGGER